jgi:tetratricopeptide (TPR) repeat protein
LRQLTAWLVISTTVAGCAPTLRTDPEASEKRYLLGADYFGKRMYRPALEELLKAVELNPQNADAHYLLGLLELVDASEAEQMIETQTCVVGGEAKLERQEIDAHFHKAEAEFQKAVESRPEYSEAWNSLSVVALHFQQWDRAAEAAQKALGNALYREPWTALGNLGWAYFHKREYLKASKELRTALFGNPQFCVGRYRLAKVYYEQKNYDSAQEELDKVTSDRSCPIQEAYLLGGLVALKRGDRERALEMLRKCTALAPKSCLAKQCQIEQ